MRETGSMLMMPPMSENTPQMIFDRKLLAGRRARAADNFGMFDFLVRRVGQDIADRLSLINRVFPLALDLGCHKGMVSQMELAPGKIGTLISADLSPAMLADLPGACVAADEEALPFADQSFALIASALSLHWVNDLPGTLIQIRRALSPDGLFMGALFGGETLTELRQAMSEAEIECEGGLSPRVSPFVDLRDMGMLLQRAGFALPVVDSDRVIVRYANMFALMADLRGMGETNVMRERRKKPLRRSTFLRAARIYQEKFGLDDGRIPVTFEIITATGWAPHASQQKPLKPGSATARLADALGTQENPVGDKAPR